MKEKTIDNEEIIEKFAEESKNILKDNIIAEYLFGSYATHEQTPLSDIDILIIVKEITLETRSKLGELSSYYSLKYDICISPILKDRSIWKKNQKYKTLFYSNIMKYGIRL